MAESAGLYAGPLGHAYGKQGFNSKPPSQGVDSEAMLLNARQAPREVRERSEALRSALHQWRRIALAISAMSALICLADFFGYFSADTIRSAILMSASALGRRPASTAWSPQNFCRDRDKASPGCRTRRPIRISSSRTTWSAPP